MYMCTLDLCRDGWVNRERGGKHILSKYMTKRISK